MSLHRFFVAGPLAAGEVRIDDESDLHHLRDVLRLGPGDEIAVTDGSAGQAVARITSIGTASATAEVVRLLPDASTPDVTLAVGLVRGPKMELVVQKATEIGVTRIVPVTMRRSVVRLGAAEGRERAGRWRRIAAEAAKQSQRATLPSVEEPVEFAQLAGVLAGMDAVLVPWEESAGDGVGEALRRAGATARSRVAVVVGPEGGMEPAEVDALAAFGAVPVTLGRTVLRAETAAIVAAALVAYELGGLGGLRRE